MSTSLKRARKPFLTRNLLTGGVIAAFAAGTFWYSIAAVQQDDFVSIVLTPAV
jgi:cytochrome c oxidase assembly factor 3